MPPAVENMQKTARDLYEKLAASRYGGMRTLRWAQLPDNEQSYWEAVWEAARELLVPTGAKAPEEANNSHPYSRAN